MWCIVTCRSYIHIHGKQTIANNCSDETDLVRILEELTIFRQNALWGGGAFAPMPPIATPLIREYAMNQNVDSSNLPFFLNIRIKWLGNFFVLIYVYSRLLLARSQTTT